MSQCPDAQSFQSAGGKYQIDEWQRNEPSRCSSIPKNLDLESPESINHYPVKSCGSFRWLQFSKSHWRFSIRGGAARVTALLSVSASCFAILMTMDFDVPVGEKKTAYIVFICFSLLCRWIDYPPFTIMDNTAYVILTLLKSSTTKWRSFLWKCLTQKKECDLFKIHSA